MIRVRATVIVTMSVDVSDVWGGDCAVSQVHKQACDSARDRIASAFAQHPDKMKGIEIGAMKPTAVAIKEDGA